jgi:serine/threonine-protein kinase
MDAERWARAKELFHDALERSPDTRDAFLREACAGDERLLETVAAMLAREPEAAGFLEASALRGAAGAVAAELARHDAPPAEAPPSAAPPGKAAPHPASAGWRRSWWMVVLALVFLADVLLRGYFREFGPQGLGFDLRERERGLEVIDVVPGGPAHVAGLRPGDLVLAVDGARLDRLAQLRVVRANFEVGRTCRVDFQRGGQRSSLDVHMRPQALAWTWGHLVTALYLAGEILMAALAGLIALKRPRDRVALKGALALATLSVSLWLHNFPPGYAAFWRNLPGLLEAVLWLPNLSISLVGPIGLTFFALFPRPLPLPRWAWVLLWLPAVAHLPVDAHWTWRVVYEPAAAIAHPLPEWIRSWKHLEFGTYGLAMLGTIAANYFRLADVSERRRLRVLIAGGAAGTLPGLARYVVVGVARDTALHDFLMSWWPDVVIAALFLLFPISFAYAVLRHRLLGVRVIVRLGVQYALARGTVASLVPAVGVALTADALVHGSEPLIDILRVRGWVYAGLTGLAVLLHTQRQRWSAAVDRRFFRDHYDARHLLRDVAEHARRAGTLARAAPAVAARLEAALHPEFAAVLFRPTGEPAFGCLASSPAGLAPPALEDRSQVVAWLRASPRTLDLAARGTDWLERWLPPREGRRLSEAHLELLVPILMGAEGHEALLAFGPKRSEEPYTGEDVDALEAIASSLALLVEHPTPQPDPLTSTFQECPQCGACCDTGTEACDKGHVPLVPVGMPRTLAGRYRLDRRLGRGGMGKVYEAIDLALDRRVAVKVIRDEWVHSADAVRRFRQEVRAVAGFGHPNVVTVHDYGVEAGSRAFLVMELLDGVTLRDELRRVGRLEPRRVLELFRGTCGAVEAAHRRQLVHRDLKPENLFLTRGPGGVTVKLLDFGVAKPLVDPGGTAPGETEGGTDTGVLVGTVGYMPPEQLLGERPSFSWDLWALAVVVYESLTGAMPFPISSRTAWRLLVLDGRFTPLSQHVPEAPPGWQDFFARTLAVDRARRPASAREFVEQLERALGPLSAAPSAAAAAAT